MLTVYRKYYPTFFLPGDCNLRLLPYRHPSWRLVNTPLVQLYIINSLPLSAPYDMVLLLCLQQNAGPTLSPVFCMCVCLHSQLLRSIPKQWKLQHCCLDFMCLKKNNVKHPPPVCWLYTFFRGISIKIIYPVFDCVIHLSTDKSYLTILR